MSILDFDADFPNSLTKTFVSAFAFSQTPAELLQMAAAGLSRMRSTKDGSAFWNVDRDVRNTGGMLSFHAMCRLSVGMGRSTPEYPSTAHQTTLTLVSDVNQFTRNDATFCGLKLAFTLNAYAVHRGAGEYHILASCAYVGMYLVERHLLMQEQLPGFWQLAGGAWDAAGILYPNLSSLELASYCLRLQPFGFGQTTADGIRRALDLRSWALASHAQMTAVGLRPDGMYQSPQYETGNTSFCWYLRFNGDGDLIFCWATTPAYAVRLLQPDPGNPPSHTVFHVYGTRIRFALLMGAHRVIDHDGEIRDGALVMNSANRITGEQGQLSFRFIPVAFAPRSAAR